MSSVILQIDFSKSGNCAEFVRSGWSAQEVEHRWAIGEQSILQIPPMTTEDDSLLLINFLPFRPSGRAQRLEILLNGVSLGKFIPVTNTSVYGVVIPREIVNREHDNILTFFHPDATSPILYGGSDNRTLAFAFKWLRVQDTVPGLAKPSESLVLWEESLALKFQSLGQNCEFGLFQRKCGAEPLGLLRFSSILLGKLLYGIQTEFQGIGDLDQLSFSSREPGSELIGHHEFYGLDYHTFRNNGSVDIEKYRAKESTRLAFLARMLMEQIDNGQKIFVVKSFGDTLNDILPLVACLCERNAKNILLAVTEVRQGEQGGTVSRFGSNLYMGRISRFAPTDNAHDFLFDEWRAICAATAESARTLL